MAAPIRSVGFLLVPGFALLSYASAVEPLRAANQIAGTSLYRWWNMTAGNAPAVSSNGAAIVPDLTLGSDTERPDMLLVCAGGHQALPDDPVTFAWLRRLARYGVIIGGISGGPILLARAGLLEGRRCTLHWEHVPAFQETFPTVELTRSLFELERRAGTARHDAVVWGYAHAASRLGVDIIQNCEVKGFSRDAAGRVTGVETSRGAIAAGKVGMAVAGSSSRVAALAGLRLPIESLVLQALRPDHHHGQGRRRDAAPRLLPAGAVSRARRAVDLGLRPVAQFSIAGPKTRDLLREIVDPAENLSDDGVPFMGAREVALRGGLYARLFRISFSGELAFEIAVPARYGDALVRHLMAAGKPLGVTPYGVEASRSPRAGHAGESLVARSPRVGIPCRHGGRNLA